MSSSLYESEERADRLADRVKEQEARYEEDRDQLARLHGRITDLEAKLVTERSRTGYWFGEIRKRDAALAEWETWFQERCPVDRTADLDELGEEVQALREEVWEWEEWFAQVDEVTYKEDGDEGDWAPLNWAPLEDDAAIGESILQGADPASGKDETVQGEARQETWEEYCARTGTSLTDTGAYFRKLAGPNPCYVDHPVGDHSAGMVCDDVEDGWASLYFATLRRGDIVRNKGSRGHSYVVTDTWGMTATAVRSVDVTQSSEWEVMRRAL